MPCRLFFGWLFFEVPLDLPLKVCYTLWRLWQWGQIYSIVPMILRQKFVVVQLVLVLLLMPQCCLLGRKEACWREKELWILACPNAKDCGTLGVIDLKEDDWNTVTVSFAWFSFVIAFFFFILWAFHPSFMGLHADLFLGWVLHSLFIPCSFDLIVGFRLV